MAKRSLAGWAVAGVLLLAWLGSNGEKKTSQPPSSSHALTDLIGSSPPANVQPANLPDISTPRSLPSPDTIPRRYERVYTTSNVRMRAKPSTAGAVVSTIPSGSAVEASEVEGAWRRVRYATYDGWVSGKFLSDVRPVTREKTPSAPPPIAPLARQTTPSRSGEAMRDPYVGTCDCPYDLMRNGRRCGNRSAYSKPGGRNPQCYF
jgi:hypothetical protein